MVVVVQATVARSQKVVAGTDGKGGNGLALDTETEHMPCAEKVAYVCVDGIET